MAKKRTLARDIELLFEVGTLRHVQRTWKHFLNPDVANVAEHTFRVMWIALTLARVEGGVDEGKLMKMALMHDITESRTGDVNYISRQYTKRNEPMAITDIVEATGHEDDVLALFHEYEERKSIEAQILKDADNLDIELELAEMRSKGHSLGKVFVNDRNKNVFTRLYTKSAKEFWKAIAKAEPNDWHLLSKNNRHRGGDWKKDKK